MYPKIKVLFKGATATVSYRFLTNTDAENAFNKIEWSQQQHLISVGFESKDGFNIVTIPHIDTFGLRLKKC